MSRRFLTNLDLAQNQLENARAQVLASAPANPVPGQFYFNDSTKTLVWWNGTEWIDARGGSGTPTGPAGGDLTGTYPNPTLSATKQAALLDRANHTGAQLASTISDLAATVQSYRLDQFAIPTSPITVPDPAADGHATNRKYVNTAVANLVGSAPETLDTLNELATALGNDPNFATTIASRIGGVETRVGNLEAKPAATTKYTANIGDGTATSFTITHNLNSRDVQVQVYANAAPYDTVETDVERTSVNAVTVRVSKAPASGAYRVVVVG